MKILAEYALAIVASAALLVGCGASQATNGTPGSLPLSNYHAQKRSQGASRLTSIVHYVYVTNGQIGRVSAFVMNAKSGALKPVRGSPFAAGTNPIGVAIDPAGTFVYVTNHGSNNVSAYAVNTSSGALMQVQGSPFATGRPRTNAVAIDPTGEFAYVANTGSHRGRVSAFAINASSGALTPVNGSPFRAGDRPMDVVALSGILES